MTKEIRLLLTFDDARGKASFRWSGGERVNVRRADYDALTPGSLRAACLKMGVPPCNPVIVLLR